MRVLYFTIVGLGAPSNGGAICCRNHVRRLAEDPAIELQAITAGFPHLQQGNDAFFAAEGVPHEYVSFRDAPPQSRAERLWAKVQFPWEHLAAHQPHIEARIAETIRAERIDVLLLEYHHSAQFVTLPRTDCRTAVIAMNREGDFYRDLLEQQYGEAIPPGRRLSLARCRAWERRIYANVDQAIAIGPPDLPKSRTRRPPVTVTPYLDPKPRRWAHYDTKRVLFVGAYGHYPNRLAIDWLVREFSPGLAAAGSEGRIVIVGATKDDVPDARANVELLGPSSPEEVDGLFCTCDLMICPVENDYGVKFKALEALAYGTPLLASWQTRKGLPHLTDSPVIDMRDPARAAELVAKYLRRQERIDLLAASQARQQAEFIRGQQGVWGKVLGALAG